jgi:hypothetical protein
LLDNEDPQREFEKFTEDLDPENIGNWRRAVWDKWLCRG